MDAALATLPTLPGALSVNASPTAALDHADSSPDYENLLDHTRWWTAPGTMADAIAYFKARPPAGRAWGGGGQATEGMRYFGDTGTVTMMTLNTADGYIDHALLTVTVVAHGDGVAIREDAQLVWTPTRLATQSVPCTITSVTVKLSRISDDDSVAAKPVIRTLNSGSARRLAAVVNSLAMQARGGTCNGLSTPDVFDELTFTGHPSITVKLVLGQCGGTATFSADGIDQPPLSDPKESLNTAVLKELGLPANYGN